MLSRFKSGVAAVGLLAAAFATPAVAQEAPAPDEFRLGPTPIIQEFQGTKVTMPVTVYLGIKSTPERLAFRARAYGDLADLQAKADRMLKSVDLPNDNCASYSSDNIVAKINQASITASGENAVLRIDGTVQVWQCIENIVQEVRIEWKVKKLCCGIKTKVPVTVRINRAKPIKNRLLSQSFEAKIPIRIVRPTPETIGVAVDRMSVDLDGDFASLLQRALFYGGVDLNAIGQRMINKTLRANTITLLVPDDFKVFQPKLEQARFVAGPGGRLKIEAILSGGLNAGDAPPAIQAIADGTAERR